MTTWILLAALASAPPTTAADSVTLRDGRALLGQVVEPSPKGKLLVVVRRAWAESNLKDLAKRWEAAEAPTLKRAREQRKLRLLEWRRDRPKVAGKEDAIGDWLDREIDRLKRPAGPDDSSRLMVVSIGRGEAKSIKRQDPRTARLLRLAWTLGLPDPESETPGDLKAAVEGRGRLVDGPDPVSIEEFLPIRAEDEARWRARRAATEVLAEPDLKFIRFQDMVLPEAENAANEGEGMAALGGVLKGLLGGEQPAEDPLLPQLRAAAARGRAGVLVTRLAIGDEASSIRVEATLWARLQGDRWEPVLSRSGDARTADAKADEAEAVGSDPRIKAVLGAVDSLGLGNLTPNLKGAGASAKRALGQARSAIQKDLDGLALPVSAGS